MKIIYIIITLILTSNIVFSQNFSVFEIDTSNSSTVKAKFYAFDKNFNQIINLSPLDFNVTENGIPKKVISVSCPTPKPPLQISSVLVIDISGSMLIENKLELARAASKLWLELLPLGKSECALTTFNSGNSLIQDFSTDRKLLIDKVYSFLVGGGTNYNAALYDEAAGGLVISKNGKNKRIIIMLTDGEPNYQPFTDEIIKEAKNQNCTVYSVVLGMGIPESLIKISNETGGRFFENVSSEIEIKNIYTMILAESLGFEPCTIEWETGPKCNNNLINAEIRCIPVNLTNYSKYTSKKLDKDNIVFSTYTVLFQNVAPGTKKDTSITITANNYDLTVFDIKSSNPLFSISPKNFFLEKGKSLDLKISYSPKDSGYAFTELIFENNSPCNYKYFVMGGFAGVKPKTKTLKLTHPNGGEVFIAGSDTVITWEGIAASDTVQLEFSKDNGYSWKLITPKTAGLSYLWKNIPLPASSKCIVRVKQLASNFNPDTLPSVEWSGTYKNYLLHHAEKIVETKDNGYIIFGSTYSNYGDFSGKKGEADYCILKIDYKGKIQWQKTYGGKLNDFGRSISPTRDGGYILMGTASSIDGDISKNLGESDIWVVKIDAFGNIMWEKSYGDKYWDNGYEIIETNEGGYLITGEIQFIISNGIYYNELSLIKTDKNGNIEWKYINKGLKGEVVYSTLQTPDDGFISVGNNWSSDSNSVNFHGMQDYFIIKFDKTGKKEWSNNYGGSLSDAAISIKATPEGNYMIGGTSHSNNFDVKSNKGNSDIWLILINPKGDLIWQKNYGGTSDDHFSDLQINQEGEIIVTGNTKSTNGDLKENKGDFDFWIFKTDISGNILMNKTFGGSKSDTSNTILQTSDGGYICAGTPKSDDGDIQNKRNEFNYFITKFSTDSYFLQDDESDKVFSIIAPEPASNDVDMKQEILGNVKDSVITNFVRNSGTYKFDVDSIYFSGADAASFALVSGIPPLEVKAGSGINVEFRFIPVRLGLHEATINIITQSAVLHQKIIGEGVGNQIEIVNNIIDFGKVFIGRKKDSLQAVTIKNAGGLPVQIKNTKHNFPNDKDFTTLSNGGSFTIEPNAVHTMNLRFSAVSKGRTNGSLEFHYDGIKSPAVVQLFGTGLPAPEIINNSPICIGDDLLLFTDSVENAGYYWTGPNGFNSTERNVVIKNAGLNQTGTYTFYYSLGEENSDTVTVNVEISNSIISPGDSSLIFLGNSTRIGKYLKLTEAKVFDKGAVWLKKKYSMKNDFTSTFEFKVSKGYNNNIKEESVPGADGFAFVFVSAESPDLGQKGGDMGYTGIPNSLAVEFDMFQNPYDPNGNHIAVQSMRTEPNIPNHLISSSLLGMSENIKIIEQDTTYYVKIEYSSVNKNLKIYFDDSKILNSPVLTINDIDLSTYLNPADGEYVYLGFTAGTGEAFQEHYVSNWVVPCPTATVGVFDGNSLLNQININPNPGSDRIEIGIEMKDNDNVSLVLTDLTGNFSQILLENKSVQSGRNNFLLNTTDLPSGIYYLKMQTSSEIIIKKVIIIK